MVSQQTFNLYIPSSSLGEPTNHCPLRLVVEHRPFKAAVGGQYPAGTPIMCEWRNDYAIGCNPILCRFESCLTLQNYKALMAKLDKAFGYEPKEWEFESSSGRQIKHPKLI